MKHLAVVLLLLITCGLASAQTPECVSLTHQALELSGFTQAVDKMTQMMSSEQFLQQMGAGREGSEEFMEIFKPLLGKNFNAEILRKELESSVAAGLQFFPDRKSTRLNSSHQIISYAVFCLKKKKK